MRSKPIVTTPNLEDQEDFCRGFLPLADMFQFSSAGNSLFTLSRLQYNAHPLYAINPLPVVTRHKTGSWGTWEHDLFAELSKMSKK